MCKYCNNFDHKCHDIMDGTIYHHATCVVGKEYDTYSFAAITENKKLLIAGEDAEQGCYYYETAKIKYCPMCGRKL